MGKKVDDGKWGFMRDGKWIESEQYLKERKTYGRV